VDKILKNTTLSAIEIEALGITVPASSSRTIEVVDYVLLASDDSLAELTPLVNSGDIIVNTGTRDLNKLDAISFLSWFDPFNIEDFFEYSLGQDYTVRAGNSKIVADCIEINDNSLIVEGILEIS
jgi:hypothetical protein